MSVMIRPAVPEDATSLTGVINPIIAAGGTTAHQTPFDPSRLLRHYIAPPGIVSCQVALLDDQPVGMQSLQWPDDEGDPFPDEWAIIASFVSPAAAGRGIGRALFAATANAAQAAGVQTIDATIRADNSVGLAYYSSLGFRDYDILRNIPLRDGTRVDRIRKRFDL